ncbi:hypothetical protein L211DRAFT_783946 [Terfezia boudieri ATCC MYA-4762]|uniref:Uncharacterized protein n=1 Tax=Terfezia boudieri ATCC MYA-4762 TaxID=1051890 RepID=A0A3N4LQ16_9PEZI|nr:hypothetical protein L211DRAFT_783946 [Terfezia boudieri ATCC MYA-4762]
MFTVLKEVDRWGLALHTSDIYRTRGTYTVPGPNYMWCINGHMKLKQYGIEIYRSIEYILDIFYRFMLELLQLPLSMPPKCT